MRSGFRSLPRTPTSAGRCSSVRRRGCGPVSLPRRLRWTWSSARRAASTATSPGTRTTARTWHSGSGHHVRTRRHAPRPVRAGSVLEPDLGVVRCRAVQERLGRAPQMQIEEGRDIVPGDPHRAFAGERRPWSCTARSPCRCRDGPGSGPTPSTAGRPPPGPRGPGDSGRSDAGCPGPSRRVRSAGDFERRSGGGVRRRGRIGTGCGTRRG